MTDLGSALGETVIFLYEREGRIPLGTGFVVGYPILDGKEQVVPLVVTAKHVIGDERMVVGRFTTHSADRPLMVEYDLQGMRSSGDLWEHQDEGVDIVVFRSPHFQEAKYAPLPLDLLASKERMASEDVKTTDRVIFPSMLVSFMGTSRNYPVVRDGSIALIPDELVPLKFNVGQKSIETKQQVLLIDTLAIQGASGSPVFLWPGPRLKGNAFAIGGTRPLLLGIMHAFYLAIPRDISQAAVSTGRLSFSENAGIAIVFPAWRLLEILESKELRSRIMALTKTEEAGG